MSMDEVFTDEANGAPQNNIGIKYRLVLVTGKVSSAANYGNGWGQMRIEGSKGSVEVNIATKMGRVSKGESITLLCDEVVMPGIARNLSACTIQPVVDVSAP